MQTNLNRHRDIMANSDIVLIRGLFRGQYHWGKFPELLKQQLVITSYSIHYTKLYDLLRNFGAFDCVSDGDGDMHSYCLLSGSFLDQ